MEVLQFDVDPEEVEVFCQEAEELVQQMDRDLLDLEQTGNDPEVVQRIFRVAHNLKGAAGTIAHHRMANLTHTMETVLDLLRQGRLDVSPTLVDLLLESADALRLLNSEVSTGTYSGFEPEDLIQRLQQLVPAANPGLVPTGQSSRTVVPVAAVSGSNHSGCPTQFRIWAQVAHDSIAPGARALQVLMALDACGLVLWSRPERAALEEGIGTFDVEVLLATAKDTDAVRKQLTSVGELTHIEIHPATDEVEALSVEAGSHDAGSSEGGPHEHEGGAGESELAKAALATSSAVAAQAQDNSLKTVRTSVERLDKLMNLVGELVTDRNRLLQAQTVLRSRYADGAMLDELGQGIAHLVTITDELQEEIMRARMLPLERVFNKFPRMIRDLARDMGKGVTLEIEGQETELDRSVIEQITDPLLHLLRNAIDHGIESAQERLAAGKPANGTVRLTGRSEGNHIIITVADDGRGIDAEKLRKSAVAKGVITEEAAARLTESESVDLIFAPGFSTAERITDVSGRGVGMDIVLHQIVRLHGTVSVTTRLGQGTTFELMLPLTLAIMPVLLVKLIGVAYCIPLASVTEVVEVPAEAVHQVAQGELTLWRSRLLPLLRLRKFFGFSGNGASAPSTLSVVAVRFGEEHAGLVVDGLLGQQEIVIKTLGSLIGQVPGITGATILGDGTVALIVDVPGLIKQATRGG